MTRLVHLLALGLALALAPDRVVGNPTCSRISAAFYYYGEMHFVIGDELITMDSNEDIKAITDVRTMDFLHDITAAVSTPSGDKFYLISGSTEQGYKDIGEAVNTNVLAKADLENAFHGEANFHGIDAAFEYDGELIYISGCSFIFVNPNDRTDIGGMMSNSDIGLPCDLDAALYSVTRGPVAIKGNQVWQLNLDTGIFVGPVHIDHVLRGLRAYHLCPIDHD